MKNKKVTYFLILAVAGLWAVIFHRIYAATNDEEDTIFETPIKKQPLFSQLNHQHDHWEFDMDYRDPFSVHIIGAKVLGEVAIDVEKPGVPFKPTVRWPELSFLGWIAGNGNTKLALLTVGGKEMMLAEGQQTLGVKLQSIASDSVKMEYEREIRYIKLK